MRSNTTGFYNTACGFQALYFNTTGFQNTATGYNALAFNVSGNFNTATGWEALFNTTGDFNTAIGRGALITNTTGSNNTAIGYGANVLTGNLTNATAIGNGATVSTSNTIVLGDSNIAKLYCNVALTVISDRTKKENFQPVNGSDVLNKIRGLELTSWNLIGQDANQFRHYGPMAQDFYAAFGHDAVGTIGTETTINGGDVAGILMSAVQALDQENVAMREENTAMKKQLAERDARDRERDARIARLEQMLPAGRTTAQKASLKTASLNSK